MLRGLGGGWHLENDHRGYQSASWLEFLEDVALGKTRLGESARRSTEPGSPMLVNLTASQLLQNMCNMLNMWTRRICESRGITEPTLDPYLTAAWLAQHVSAIACDEAAGEMFTEVQNAVNAIERAINRPIPPKYCGPCPTVNEDQSRCGVELYVKRELAEVQCWKCKLTYNADDLIDLAMLGAGELLYSAREIQELMASIGEPISPRTWRHWRKEDKLIDRSEALGSEPKYWIRDVRRLMAQKPQKAATGAAARQTA